MNYFGRLKSWIRARIKRLTATTSKTAIAVLSAVIIILVVSVSAFKSIRFFCWEHPGILIVVIAVAGEVICDWNRKKTLKERLKKIFGMLLVGGLLLEVAEAVKSDKKVASANLEAKQAVTNAATSNERAAVAEKEAGAANERAAESELKLKQLTTDRSITDQQQNEIATFLKSEPRLPIGIVTTADSGETFRFATRVREVLDASGYTNHSGLPPDFSGVSINEVAVNPSILPVVFRQTDLEIWMNLEDFVSSSNTAGNVAFKLFQAFQLVPSISVEPVPSTNLPAGEIFVFVSEKQNPK